MNEIILLFVFYLLIKPSNEESVFTFQEFFSDDWAIISDRCE